VFGSPPIVRDVTARGTRTRVVEFGSGVPLLLVHDLFCSHHAFDDVIEPLSRNFHVIALDLPGFGDSEKPPPSRYPYTLETFAEVVTDVIAALQVGRSHLIGHGLGGGVALTLAAEHPEFVDHLVLVSPHILPARLPPPLRYALLPLFGRFIFKQVFGRTMFRRYFQRQVYGPGHEVPLERIDSYFRSFNTPAAREGAYSALHASRDTRPSVARLTRVRAPTLLVWGRADTITPPLHAPRLVRQLATAHMEFTDSGHSPHEEHPERFVQVVQRFLLDQRQ
jgi:pimeloyl-ACP methyl ester carboxylesterase